MSVEKPKSHEDMIKELEEERLLNVDKEEEESLRNLGYYKTSKLSPQTKPLEVSNPKSYETKALDAGELRKIINEPEQGPPVTKSIENPEDFNELKGVISDLNREGSKSYNPGLWRTVMKQFRDFIKGREKK